VNVEHAEIARSIATASLGSNRQQRPDLIGPILMKLDLPEMMSVVLQLGDLIDFIYGSWYDRHTEHGSGYRVPEWDELMLWATKQDGERR
jgi:hypothetical protein